MDILLSINILAVAGTSLLMMAVATVWFSSSVFGELPLSSSGKVLGDVQQRPAAHILLFLALTFLSNAVLVCVLAGLVLIAPILSIPPLCLACAAYAFALVLIGLLILWEQRSLTHYAIYAGYTALFIFGSTVVLLYWPW